MHILNFSQYFIRNLRLVEKSLGLTLGKGMQKLGARGS